MRVIVVHTLEHALIALEAAHELKTPLAVQTAPDAIFQAGPLYLLHMFGLAHAAYPDVELTCIVDCGEAMGEALTAMQIGHKHVRLSELSPVRDKLADIAGAYGVTVHEEPAQALDMFNLRDGKIVCLAWLKKIETVKENG